MRNSGEVRQSLVTGQPCEKSHFLSYNNVHFVSLYLWSIKSENRLDAV